MEPKNHIPDGVSLVLRRMVDAGFEGYLVGGCVRDRYMGYPPHDYDVTTSALPEEMMEIFRGERIIETGLQHGTVTVMTADGPVEVTTYRQDGDYSDHRHPDQVTFTRSLREDLARRDFTMNAMAMDAEGEMVDPFDGRADIKARLIRCVGEADRRFEEDALRILRGLRFAARLGFDLETETSAAMHRKKQLLNEIAAERVFKELCGLLEGAYAATVLEHYGEVVSAVLPQLSLEKENLKRLQGLPARSTLRLATLLTESAASEVLRQLKVSSRFRQEVLMLVREGGKDCLPDRLSVRRRCAELGAEHFILLCEFQQNEKAKSIAEQLLKEGACLTIRDLAVSGQDLLTLGFKGPAVGDALNCLLEQVTEERLPNEKDILLEYLKR